MDTEQTNLSIEQVLGVLRRRAPWILLCVVLVAGAAYGFSKHQTKKYTATASLVFSNNQLSQQVAGLAVANSNNQLAEQNTNLKLVQLGDMASKTARRLGQGLTKEKVNEALSVSAQGESNIVDVAATATSPTLAAGIANKFLPAAREVGALTWSLELARLILPAANEPSPPIPVADINASDVLAAITGGRAWDEFASRIPDQLWEAGANMLAGRYTARTLADLLGTSGEAAVFAAFNAFLLVVVTGHRVATAASPHQLIVLRETLGALATQKLPASLLADIADTTRENFPDKLEAELRLLRAVEPFAAGGRDPAMLARLDPDVATMLRIADPALAQAERERAAVAVSGKRSSRTRRPKSPRKARRSG